MGAKKCETAKKTMGKVRKNYGKMRLSHFFETVLNIDARIATLIWWVSMAILMLSMLFFSC